MRKAPKTLIIVACSFVLFSLAIAYTPTQRPNVTFWNAPPSIEFDDMEHFGWSLDSVNRLVGWGIMSGDAHDYQNNFRPNFHMTRAEFSGVLVRAFGAYNETASVPRHDNFPERWYYVYVSSLIESGIAQGYSDEYFGAFDTISRQDMALLIQRTMEFAEFDVPIVDETPIIFADADEIRPHAREAVAFLAARGLLRGDRYGRFRPELPAERVEIATIIDRVLTNGTPATQ